MSDIQRYAPERMLVLYDDHAKIVANLRAINEAGDEVINTQAADIRRLESQIARLESRLAAADEMRLAASALCSVTGHEWHHLEADALRTLRAKIAAYDATKEPAK